MSPSCKWLVNSTWAQEKVIVQLLSTKIVQISDTSMKLSQITKGPKGNIFWCRAKPNKALESKSAHAPILLAWKRG